MKSILLGSLLALSLTANANISLPSFSNADFEATQAKAQSVALSTAQNFAADMGLELTDLKELDSSPVAMSAKFLASTESECQFIVSVGLFFRSKVTSTSNCQ